MNKEEKIKIEVEKTLNVYDEVKQLESNPFLYTRIKSKLDKRGDAGRKEQSWSLLNSFRPAFFIFLITINVFTVINSFENSNNEITSENSLNTFSEEYSLDADNYNSIEKF